MKIHHTVNSVVGYRTNQLENNRYRNNIYSNGMCELRNGKENIRAINDNSKKEVRRINVGKKRKRKVMEEMKKSKMGMKSMSPPSSTKSR
ncbi:myb-like protein X [Vespula maculifrons]|uniref:Myb-like protein X n=1 Tax=Vespula maculifrons TaxID=7453 RepID=A0ABD2CLW2_VESMC